MKQKYWFKVHFGKWEDGDFDPEDSFAYVEAWNARHAYDRANRYFGTDDDEVIIGIEYLGYPQGKMVDEEEDEGV